jgi:hypothetical protein
MIERGIYDEIAGFMAGMDPKKVIAFKPSEANQNRLSICRSLLLLALMAVSFHTNAQSVLAIGNTPNGPYLYSFNTLDCSYCPFMVAPPGDDFLVLPNGDILAMRSVFPNVEIKIYAPPSNSPLQTFVLPLLSWYDCIEGPGTILYVSGREGLYTFDYNTGTLTFIGQWPMAHPFIMPELIVINGTYYGLGGVINSGVRNFYRLDMGDPSQSVLLFNDVSIMWQDGLFGINNGPMPGVFVADFAPGNQTLQVYDTTTNNFNLQCPLAPNLGGFYNETPLGVSYNCLCLTDAGTVPTPNATRCVNEVFAFTHTGGFLESDDVRQFILFTNPNDTLGSIIAISDTPSFGFDPAAMQTGVTYYFATIAGDDLNGGVDLNDPCLDISNARELIWRPLPGVTFSISNPDLCAGECRTVTADFTGTPPFILTYNTPFGGTITQTFPGATGAFEVCIPANVSPGPIIVEALQLVDAWCSCN